MISRPCVAAVVIGQKFFFGRKHSQRQKLEYGFDFVVLCLPGEIMTSHKIYLVPNMVFANIKYTSFSFVDS